MADDKINIGGDASMQSTVAPKANEDSYWQSRKIDSDPQAQVYGQIMQDNESEDNLAKYNRERRDKAKKLIAAVSDGVRSMANLYFASKGAPNMYDPNTSMYARETAEQDKAAADREAKKAKFLEASLARGKRREEIANAERAAQAMSRQQRMEDAKEAREQESHSWTAALQPDKMREQKGKADKSGYEAISAAYDAANAPALADAKLAAEKALANQRNASANASGAAAENSLASAAEHNRGNLQEFSAWDTQGNEHKFKTKAAADEFARREGTFQPLSNTKTVNAGRQSRTETTESGRGYAKKVAPQPKKDADNAPPSKRKAAESKANNDNTPPSRRNKK